MEAAREEARLFCDDLVAEADSADADQSYPEAEPALIEVDQADSEMEPAFIEADQPDFELEPAFIEAEPAFAETRLAAA